MNFIHLIHYRERKKTGKKSRFINFHSITIINNNHTILEYKIKKASEIILQHTKSRSYFLGFSSKTALIVAIMVRVRSAMFSLRDLGVLAVVVSAATGFRSAADEDVVP